MNDFRWRPCWWRLSIRTERDYHFSPTGPGLRPVPNRVIAAGETDAWAQSMLLDADDSLDDFRGEVRMEIFDSPDGSHLVRVYDGLLTGGAIARSMPWPYNLDKAK